MHTFAQKKKQMQNTQSTKSAKSRRKRENAVPMMPATIQVRRHFVQEAIQFLKKSVSYYQLIRLDQTLLRRVLDGLKLTVENSQWIINSFLQREKTLQEQLRQAYRNAVGALVRRASQQLTKTTHEIYQANRSRIHEWGWPQATQDTAAHSYSATLPVEIRKRIRVIKSGFDVSDLHNLFSTRGGRTTIPLPKGVTVVFAGTIPKGLQHGLRNVAGMLIPTPLTIDSTIILALDLGTFGGDYESYRFTYVENRSKRGSRTHEVIIERLGLVGIEGLAESQRRLQLQRFRRFDFKRGSGWSDSEFERLLAAIGQVADQILVPVSGLTFNRAAVHATKPITGGDYNPETHTITLYDISFTTSLTRLGTPGTTGGIQTRAVNSIVHEIGHAIDLLPLRRAWRSLEQAGEALQTAFKQYENPPGSKRYRFPNTEQARYNRLNRQISQARQAYIQAHSVSGSRKRQRGGVWETKEFRRGGRNIEFRKAAREDGATFPTNYPNPENWWKEYFAESFSLYINSPSVLQQLRPKVYSFFITKFPR